MARRARGGGRVRAGAARRRRPDRGRPLRAVRPGAHARATGVATASVLDGTRGVRVRPVAGLAPSMWCSPEVFGGGRERPAGNLDDVDIDVRAVRSTPADEREVSIREGVEAGDGVSATASSPGDATSRPRCRSPSRRVMRRCSASAGSTRLPPASSPRSTGSCRGWRLRRRCGARGGRGVTATASALTFVARSGRACAPVATRCRSRGADGGSCRGAWCSCATSPARWSPTAAPIFSSWPARPGADRASRRSRSRRG